MCYHRTEDSQSYEKVMKLLPIEHSLPTQQKFVAIKTERFLVPNVVIRTHHPVASPINTVL